VSPQIPTAEPKPYPWNTDPVYPVFVTVVTLQGNQTKDMPFPNTSILMVVEMTKNGVNAGDVSIALGEAGDFWDLAPGDLLEVSRFSQVQFRNNTPAVKTFKLLHTTDHRFSLRNYPRGL